MLSERLAMMIKFCAAILLFISLFACGQKITFYSEPPGARVAVNDHYVGETPCRYSSRSLFESDHQVEISKEGFMPQLVAVASSRPFYHFTLTPTLAR